MSGGKITKPGQSDNEWMVVTCTPDSTSLDFFETEPEAIEGAKVNLHPATSVYVGKLTRQGEHPIRGTSRHIAVMVELDDETRRAIEAFYTVGGRARTAELFTDHLAQWLDDLRATYRALRGVL